MLYRPKSTWTWIAFVASLTQVFAVVALQGYIAATCYTEHAHSNGHDLPSSPQILNTASLGLFIFSTCGYVYQLLLIYDTLAKRNTIQVIFNCLYSAAMTTYAGLQYKTISDLSIAVQASPDPEISSLVVHGWTNATDIAIAIAAVNGAFTLVLCYISWRLYDEFQWELLEYVNANRTVRRMFLTFQLFVSLLKYNAFFSFGYLLQFLLFTLSTQTFTVFHGTKIVGTRADTITTSMFIVMSTLSGPLASASVRQENLPGVVFATMSHLALLGYFIYKFVRFYRVYNVQTALHFERLVVTFWGSVTILLTICTIVIECVCVSNFGKDLKRYILSDTQRQKWQVKEEMELQERLRERQRRGVSGQSGTTTVAERSSATQLLNDQGGEDDSMELRQRL